MKKLIEAARKSALLVAVAVLLVSIGIGTIGLPRQVLLEGSTSPTSRLVPTRQALVAASASAVVAVGLVARVLPIAWAGVAGLAAFSAVFLHSIGAFYIPAVLLLAALLALGRRKR